MLLGLAEHPFAKIRQKYDEITKQLLQADSVPGLDEKSLFAFKRTYGSSVLICRFTDCPRGLHGFETSHERDAHEKTHLPDLKCPHLECLYNRTGLKSVKKLKQHLEEFHPKEDGVKLPSSIRPYGESRVLTGVTLVESPEAGVDSKYESDASRLQDEDDDDDDVLYPRVEKVLGSDIFALGTTRWSE